VAVPSAPPLTAVATPSPEIAFALPTQGPMRVVEASKAVPMPPADTTAVQPTDTAPAPGPAAVKTLTYGQGEGRQPAPEYPREAVIGREQGTVVVHFTVDENGRVVKAEAAKSCPWPLLNQAAVRAVRETWRFGAGPVRSYEVSIQFQLTER
jgi:protein TonB